MIVRHARDIASAEAHAAHDAARRVVDAFGIGPCALNVEHERRVLGAAFAGTIEPAELAARVVPSLFAVSHRTWCERWADAGGPIGNGAIALGHSNTERQVIRALIDGAPARLTEDDIEHLETIAHTAAVFLARLGVRIRTRLGNRNKPIGASAQVCAAIARIATGRSEP